MLHGWTWKHKLLEALSLACMVGMAALVLVRWDALPAQVPMHYGAGGEIDGWGDKWTIWVVPAMGALCGLCFLLALCIPREKWNMPVKLTDSNREAAYRLTLTMMLMLQLETILVFVWLCVCQCFLLPLGAWFLVFSIAAPIATLIFFLARFAFLPH